MAETIAYFTKLKAMKYKYTQFEIVKHIRALQRRTYGLTLHERIIIFNILFNSRISYGNFRNLLYSIIPGSTVREEEVKQILIWMIMNLHTSQKKCSAILVWLSVMLDFNLCDKKAVKKFYPQFIFMFKAGFQVQYACKIIYDLTAPADISRWMVQEFLLYWKKYPKNKPVGAILSCFKHYRADLVPENVPQVSPKTAFSFMSPHDLLHNLNEIIGLQIPDLISEFRHFGKKQAVEIIPPMLYLNFKRNISKRSGRLRLYEFGSALELAANQSSIELPHNTLSLIADERGYLVLSCENVDTQFRLCSELYEILFNAFITDDPLYDLENKRKLLRAVISFLEFMQIPMSVVSTFLVKYLQIWDGTSYAEEVLHLLPWLSFVTNKDYLLTFKPAMESLFLTISVEKKCSLVSAMGNFIINLVVRSKSQRRRLFGGLVENFDQAVVVSNVVSFIFDLCANQMFHEDDQYLLHASLDLFDLVCTLSETNHIPLNIPLPASIAYRALLSKEATSLTRLCSTFLRLPQISMESDTELIHGSIDYMLGMFKDFYWCLLSAKHLKGHNLIFDDNSQYTVFIKELMAEEGFMNISKHLAFSLLFLQYTDRPLNAHDIARTAEEECKSIADFLLYYRRVYYNRK